MKPAFRLCLFFSLLVLSTGYAASERIPTHANVSFGPDPIQLLDVYVPPKGEGPFPVLIWYGGIWKPAKHVPDLNQFHPHGIAVIGVQTRTLVQGQQEKVVPPVKLLMDDACRAVQFVRLNAAKWKLDPERIVVGGGSQGALPALYVGCVADRAVKEADDPVKRVSTRVRGVAAYRSQPSIDPVQMQKWVPGVKWGAPALGYSFEASLARREELRAFRDLIGPAEKEPGVYEDILWGLLNASEFSFNW